MGKPARCFSCLLGLITRARRTTERVASVILVISLTVGCGARSASIAPTAEPTHAFDPAQVYAVYSALLSSWSGTVVVNKELGHFDPSAVSTSIRIKLPEVDRATWEDLQVREEHPRELETHFDLPPDKVRLIDSSERDKYLELAWPERCKAFAETYSGARVRVRFSAVAFNPRMDEAILIMAHIDCNGCGGEDIVYLRKVDGKWTFQGRTPFIDYVC